MSTSEEKTIDSYIAALDGDLAATVSACVDLVRATAPKAEGLIKWAQPVFEQDGPFCYVKAYKKHVNFGFWRGAELDDPKGLLEGSGDKMRHVKLTQPGEVKKAALKALVKQAVKLNQLHGDPTQG